jgi:hypothetical protein
LSSLVFVPLANQAWKAPGGTGNDALRIIQGPGGALMQDLQGKSSIKVTPGAITALVQSGVKFIVTAGGTPAAVQTTAGPSPVLFADG